MTRWNDVRFVRTKELAEKLNVSRITVWRWERAGLIPAKIRLGQNTVGWNAETLEKWFSERSATLAPPIPDRCSQVKKA